MFHHQDMPFPGEAAEMSPSHACLASSPRHAPIPHLLARVSSVSLLPLKSLTFLQGLFQRLEFSFLLSRMILLPKYPPLALSSGTMSHPKLFSDCYRYKCFLFGTKTQVFEHKNCASSFLPYFIFLKKTWAKTETTFMA